MFGHSYYHSGFNFLTYLCCGVGIIVIILLINGFRKRGKVTLSLSKFEFKPEFADFLIIEGRKTGLWQWILTQLKLGNRYQILVNKERICYSADSAKGNTLVLTPLQKVASTGGGYTKPISMLIIAAILAGVGIILALSSATAGIISILVAVLLIVWYNFKKTFFISIQPVSGAVFGFEFKRSIIENVAVDIDLIKESISFLNEKVVEVNK